MYDIGTPKAINKEKLEQLLRLYKFVSSWTSAKPQEPPRKVGTWEATLLVTVK
jgi:hypothetical protein